MREVYPDGLEEAFGVVGGGTGVDPSDEVLADGGDGFELLELFAVPGERHVIDPNEFSGAFGALSVSPALSVSVEDRRRLALVRPRQ